MVEFTCSAVKLVGELAPVHKKPFTVDKLLSNYFSKSDASTCLTLKYKSCRRAYDKQSKHCSLKFLWCEVCQPYLIYMYIYVYQAPFNCMQGEVVKCTVSDGNMTCPQAYLAGMSRASYKYYHCPFPYFCIHTESVSKKYP